MSALRILCKCISDKHTLSDYVIQYVRQNRLEINMSSTQIRANTQLTNKLKQLIDVRGKKESMAKLIDDMVTNEFVNYGYTQDGLVKAGDSIQLADIDRKLTNTIVRVVEIKADELVLSNGSIVQPKGRVMFFSKIHKRA